MMKRILHLSNTKKLFDFPDHLIDGKGAERPFVDQILESGQTGIMDRGYQCHKTFDLLQSEKKHFVCRIKGNTKKTEIKLNEITPGSMISYDAVVLLGTPGVNQTEKEIRLILRVGRPIGSPQTDMI